MIGLACDVAAFVAGTRRRCMGNSQLAVIKKAQRKQAHTLNHMPNGHARTALREQLQLAGQRPTWGSKVDCFAG